MGDILSEIQDKIRKQSQSIPAKRLREKLIPLKSAEEQSAKRWFWELLQNASDYNESVDVFLEVSDDKVTFKHNGKPFSIEDVLNLIKPDSGKDNDERKKENIGKFGSGLVSTHILSSEIIVNGAFTSQDSDELNKFEITLDRSSYENKDELIDSIELTSKQFQDNYYCIEKIDYNGFMTSFSYNLKKILPKLSDKINVVEIGLTHIYDILPYTLCFLPKVNSVKVCDVRKSSSVKEYYISRLRSGNRQEVFEVFEDDKTFKQSFVKLKHKKVETVYQFNNGLVVPLPMGVSKIFCGLPMIGTENIGLPYVINSFDFEPKLERNGVEITTNDKENIEIFNQGVELYELLLNDISSRKLDNAFHLTHLTEKFVGQEGSKGKFKRDFVPKFKKLISKSKIVKNINNEFIPFSDVVLPYYYRKPFAELYGYASMIKNKILPSEKSFEGWVNSIDFSLFPEQKYNLEKFVSEISEIGHTKGFILEPNTSVILWLKNISSLINEIDESLFKNYSVLPNQKGQLCKSESLYIDGKIPIVLKEIYNSLSKEEIEIKLLDSNFNDLNIIISKSIDTNNICNHIDDYLKENYKKNNASTSSFIKPLNSLYRWLNSSKMSNKDLEKLFPWFFPKRATLFMDSFGEIEREYAFSIVQSGKIKALALLADSDITKDELEYLSENPFALSKMFAFIQSDVDDKKNANIETGEIGEKLVLMDLQKKFQKASGFEIIWSSRKGEARFDFEIKLKGKTHLYIDAKTTMRGISNSDSIPFYMRNSQWEFLPKIDNDVKYLIARVFQNGKTIKYLQLDLFEK